MKLTAKQVLKCIRAGVDFGEAGAGPQRAVRKGQLVLHADGSCTIVVPTTADQQPATKAFTAAIRDVLHGEPTHATWRAIQGNPKVDD